MTKKQDLFYRKGDVEVWLVDCSLLEYKDFQCEWYKNGPFSKLILPNTEVSSAQRGRVVAKSRDYWFRFNANPWIGNIRNLKPILIPRFKVSFGPCFFIFQRLLTWMTLGLNGMGQIRSDPSPPLDDTAINGLENLLYGNPCVAVLSAPSLRLTEMKHYFLVCKSS